MTARSTSPDSAASPVLLRGDIDGIALLSLNRPQTRNTLSEAMLAALHEQFAAIAKDDHVRAVIISHNGPAFSAGHDMKEMTAHRSDPDRGRGYFKALMQNCSAMMMAIQNLPQPVIAAVEGVASRRRLPAGRQLRLGGGVRNGAVLDAGRAYRAVLLDADGGAVAQRRRTNTPWKCCSPATWFPPPTRIASA